MDENTIYFFVAQKVVVNHSKVFIRAALCTGGQMKRIHRGQASSGHAILKTWKPRFIKCCFNIYFTCWHIRKLKSFHSSFKGAYSFYIQVILLKLFQKISAPSASLTSVPPTSPTFIVQRETPLWTPPGKLHLHPAPGAWGVRTSLLCCPPALPVPCTGPQLSRMAFQAWFAVIAVAS